MRHNKNKNRRKFIIFGAILLFLLLGILIFSGTNSKNEPTQISDKKFSDIYNQGISASASGKLADITKTVLSNYSNNYNVRLAISELDWGVIDSSSNRMQGFLVFTCDKEINRTQEEEVVNALANKVTLSFPQNFARSSNYSFFEVHGCVYAPGYKFDNWGFAVPMST